MYHSFDVERDVNLEIEESFNKKPKDFTVLILIFVVILIVVVAYVSSIFLSNSFSISYADIDGEYIDANGEITSFSGVKVVKITQNVFDAIGSDPEWSEYLFGDKKNVLFIYRDGCPYARAYDNQISKSFYETPLLYSYYSKNIIKVPQSYSLSCKSEYCPRIWIEGICGANFCIINPATKEIIVDTSHDSSQINPLLNTYMLWTNDKLLK